MNKLIKDMHFSQAESTINQQRSIFNLSHGHHMTMNAGKLYPFFFSEVLPGDTFNIKDAFVARTSTPLKTAVMDTAVFDQWYFYVPMRLVWEHTKEFFGENNTSAWTPNVEYFIPQINPGVQGFKADGVADNFGIPTYANGLPVSALPFRAYRLIWNEWFRDQNTQDPKLINFGDVESDLTLDDLLPVNKRKDYFTTALPEPQKGPDVLLPLSGWAPVVTRSLIHDLGDDPTSVTWYSGNIGQVPIGQAAPYFLYHSADVDNKLFGQFDKRAATMDGDVSPAGAIPYNLWADFSAASAQSTINDLRQAFAVQSLFELDARGGSRYREFLRVHFGVNVPDLTVQVPEFLGGKSTEIGISQVVQTSSSVGESAQGNITGFSKTVGRGGDFIKSFDEPGFLIGVCSVRQLPSYQQGLDRFWSRRSRLDFYHPVLAHIGEQPVLNKELYVYNEAARDEVFGYQEAFGDLRYKQSYVSGAFRSNYPYGPLDSWTYTYDFESLPVLSDEWMQETDVNIARTLVTEDMEGAPQFIVDFWFDFEATRPMPVFGTPAMLGRQ